MSSYLDIYLRDNHNQVVLLAWYGRSSYLYQLFYEEGFSCSDEVCRPISKNQLISLIEELQHKKSKYLENIAQYKENKTLIGSWNNSMQEKLDQLYELDSSIDGCQEEIGFIDESISVLSLLVNMIESVYYKQPDETIYVGIDCRKPEFEIKNDDEEQ